MKTLKNKIWAAIYAVIFINAYSELENLVVDQWLEVTLSSSRYYKILFMLVISVIYCVTLLTFLQHGQFRQWRSVMKIKLWGWIVLVVYSIAFIVLMVEICIRMQDVVDAIRVLAAASVIFVPNALALTQLIKERGEMDSSQT